MTFFDTIEFHEGLQQETRKKFSHLLPLLDFWKDFLPAHFGRKKDQIVLQARTIYGLRHRQLVRLGILNDPPNYYVNAHQAQCAPKGPRVLSEKHSDLDFIPNDVLDESVISGVSFLTSKLGHLFADFLTNPNVLLDPSKANLGLLLDDFAFDDISLDRGLTGFLYLQRFVIKEYVGSDTFVGQTLWSIYDNLTCIYRTRLPPSYNFESIAPLSLPPKKRPISITNFGHELHRVEFATIQLLSSNIHGRLLHESMVRSVWHLFKTRKHRIDSVFCLLLIKASSFTCFDTTGLRTIKRIMLKHALIRLSMIYRRPDGKSDIFIGYAFLYLFKRRLLTHFLRVPIEIAYTLKETIWALLAEATGAVGADLSRYLFKLIFCTAVIFANRFEGIPLLDDISTDIIL